MTRSGEGIRFVIEIEVTDVPGFIDGARQCVEISRDEPGTLVYDWYLDEETGKARLYEAYASTEALAEHTAGRVFTEVGPKLLETCTFIHVDAFGDLGDAADGPSFWPTTYWGEAFTAVSS